MEFHTYRCIGNYQKMDWGEMILKVGEGYTSKLYTYHSYGIPIALWVLQWGLGWRCENLGLIHKPYTRYWALFTHHYWVFSGNAYFWNNSSLKFGVEEYATPHGYQKSRWYLPWCNFEWFQSQVKSHYFSERIDWGSVDCCFSFRKNTCVAVKL